MTNNTLNKSGSGKKKEQKIVVFTTLSPADKNLILTGIKIASIFKKELCLAFHLPKKQTEEEFAIKQKLLDYTVPLRKEIPALITSVLLLKEPLAALPQLLADDYEAILLIAASSIFKKHSRAVTESPVPYLFIPGQSPISSFKKIVYPLDLRKENSDGTLWCTWFGRFNRSKIVAVAANDKNSDSREQVTRNAYQAKKLFQKFQIAHKIFKGKKGSLQNSFEALEYARTGESDLFIMLGSSVITPLDRLIGLPERKIIKKAYMPVLLINPRRDNYILCD